MRIPFLLISCSLVAAFCLGAGAFAGGVSDGGSDPIEVAAKPFPDPTALDDAISEIKARLAKSAYSLEFRNAITIEADRLRAFGKYLYLPVLIIMGNAGPQGYDSPQDITRFITLGAMTRMQLGAPVFFAERVVSYSKTEFAHLLLHELLHHVLGAVSSDEKYVEELTVSLFEGRYSRSLEMGFTHRIAIRNGFVSARGLFELIFDRVASTAKIRLVKIPFSSKTIHSILETQSPFTWSENASQISELDFTNSVQKVIFENADFFPLVLDPLGASIDAQANYVKGRLNKAIIQALEGLTVEVGAQPEWLSKERTPGCKSKQRFLSGCKSPIFILDLIDPVLMDG